MRRSLGSFLTVGQVDAGDGDPAVAQFLGDAAQDDRIVVTARTVLRASDAIARFGGEEFVLLLPDATAYEAHAAGGRLQRALAQRALLHENLRVFVTFSAGVAVCQAGESADSVIRRADRAMYSAKQAGKNRVVDAD